MIRWLGVVWLVLLGGGVWAAEDGGYIGAGGCGACHAAQAATQGRTAHAGALRAAGEHGLAGEFATGKWQGRAPDFQLRYLREGGRVRAQGYDARNTMDIAVDWAFGSGEQAVTLVTRIDKDWYLEHYFSYYRATGGMGVTAGHGVLRPKTLAEAMGLPYRTLDAAAGIVGCFECHSTGPVRRGKENLLEPGEAGVRCEACHGPGREHAAAAGRGEVARARRLIGNPKRETAAGLLEKCGKCHRPPAGPGTRIDWSYAWNVRHQPVYLAQSACMTRSGGRLTCLTCHEAHEPARAAGGEWFEQRCQGCHGTGACKTGAKAGCVGCHMPKVRPQAETPLRFTNHWIGVYGAGNVLRPR